MSSTGFSHHGDSNTKGANYFGKSKFQAIESSLPKLTLTKFPKNE